MNVSMARSAKNHQIRLFVIDHLADGLHMMKFQRPVRPAPLASPTAPLLDLMAMAIAIASAIVGFQSTFAFVGVVPDFTRAT